jgi:hypothetical protein
MMLNGDQGLCRPPGIGCQPSLRNFVGAKAALDIHRSNRKRTLHSAGSPRTVRLIFQSFQRLFPVLLDIERPLELQMGLVVIVDELRHGGVVATAEHARGSGLGLDWEGISGWTV